MLDSNQRPKDYESAAVDPHRTILRGSGLLSCALVHGEFAHDLLTREQEERPPRRSRLTCFERTLSFKLGASAVLGAWVPRLALRLVRVEQLGRRSDPRLSALTETLQSFLAAAASLMPSCLNVLNGFSRRLTLNIKEVRVACEELLDCANNGIREDSVPARRNRLTPIVSDGYSADRQPVVLSSASFFATSRLPIPRSAAMAAKFFPLGLALPASHA